jgi:hypothetical protein
MSIQPTCRNCRFWHRTQGEDSGRCRRQAPIPTAVRNRFPHAAPDDWCGEYKERTFHSDNPGAGLGGGFDDSPLYDFLDSVAAAFGFVRKEPKRKSDRPCRACLRTGLDDSDRACEKCGGTGYEMVF